MMRGFAAAAVLLAVSGLAAGCASLNPFASSKPKPSAAEMRADVEAPAAQPAKPKRPPESMGLVRFDADKNGQVSRAELEQGLTADSKKEDVNGDETLDITETRALNERLRTEQGASPVFDWNADGRIVFTEFASQWRTLFQRSDINGDGVIDEEELLGKRREMKPRPLPKPEFSGRDGRPPGSP